MGALYQSLGAAYAQMFQFHRAYRAYDKAYGLDHDREVLKTHLFSERSGSGAGGGRYLWAAFKPEFKGAWEEELRQARTDGEQAGGGARAADSDEAGYALPDGGRGPDRWAVEERVPQDGVKICLTKQ